MGVQSPCINVCKMDSASGLCLGCYRSLEEIAAWGRASEAQRIAILQQVKARVDAGTVPARLGSAA